MGPLGGYKERRVEDRHMPNRVTVLAVFRLQRNKRCSRTEYKDGDDSNHRQCSPSTGCTWNCHRMAQWFA